MNNSRETLMGAEPARERQHYSFHKQEACRSYRGAPGRYRSCFRPGMLQLHSRPKEQREAIRNLVHLVLTRDMGTFNPERFKDWIRDMDARFRKVGLTL